jgi:ATP-binding protein involved in chromosome partitioning
MSNPNTKQIQEILSSHKLRASNLTLADCIESIRTDDEKTHIIIACAKDSLDEFKSLVELAELQFKDLGIEAKIILTNTDAKIRHSRLAVKGVKQVIEVASGKGGVGKSTIALNLAITLAQSGKKVGLVDADIYGPSLPSLTGINKKPVLEDNLMIPHKKFGLKLMSIGFLVNDVDALIWRGPMTTKMLHQLIRLTNWEFDGEMLDYLIIDTPPGTGDVHLSLAENYKIDGAIVISTTQTLATADVTRALTMFSKLDIPVLGIIENYSYICDKDGNKQYLFGSSHTNTQLAKKFKTKVLAQIPINSDLDMASSNAKPLTYYKPNHLISLMFKDICKGI